MSNTAAPAAADEGIVRLAGGEVFWATIVLSIAPFLSVVDLTMVNIILPHIAGGYGATPNEVTLVVTFFAVSQAISMPLSGWLAGRFGVVRIFLIALFLFALSSLLCGLAPSLGALVAARIFQGLSAGPIVPLSQAIMQRTFPPKYLSSGLIVWGMALMSGPLVGPALGGFLADTVGWPWGFFVNMPIAALCIMLVMRMFRRFESPTAKLPIDVIGLALMVIWVTAAQFVLDQGRELEWFASPLIVMLSVVAIIGFVSFVIWEWTEEHPIVDLSPFRYRSFIISAVITSICYGAATGGAVMVYLWAQTGLNYDATTAGMVSAITGAPGLIVGPLAAMITHRVDIRVLATIGLGMTASTMLLRTQFVTQIDFLHLVTPQIFVGISGPFFWGPLIAIGMSEIPHHKVSSAAGLLTFTRTIAFAMQIALLTTYLEYGTKHNNAELAGALNQPALAVHSLQGLGFSALQATQVLAVLVEKESFVLALHRLMWFLAICTICCMFAVWLVPRAKPQAGGAPVAAE